MAKLSLEHSLLVLSWGQCLLCLNPHGEMTFLTLGWFSTGAKKHVSTFSERNNKNLTVVPQYIVSNLHYLEVFSLSVDFFFLYKVKNGGRLHS